MFTHTYIKRKMVPSSTKITTQEKHNHLEIHGNFFEITIRLYSQVMYAKVFKGKMFYLHLIFK